MSSSHTTSSDKYFRQLGIEGRVNIYKLQKLNLIGSMSKNELSMHQNISDQQPDTTTTKSRSKVLRKPSMFKVLLYNDKTTPMEFVVQILQQFFYMSTAEATDIMLSVHSKGVGICGIYTYEVAETKKNQVSIVAKRAQHPLKCSLERV